MKSNIAIIGSTGYVGSALFNCFSLDNNFLTYKITKNNFKQFYDQKFDLVINASNPAKRYISELDPIKDYNETVEKTKHFLSKYKYDKFINISSLSVRTNPESVYGRNRKIVEDLVLSKNNIVIRLGPMFGGITRNSTLQDIINNNPVKYSKDTSYGYCNINWSSVYIHDNIYNFDSLVEIGANDSITLGEIAKKIGSSTIFGSIKDDQYLEGFYKGPTAQLVVDHAIYCKNNNVDCG